MLEEFSLLKNEDPCVSSLLKSGVSEMIWLFEGTLPQSGTTRPRPPFSAESAETLELLKSRMGNDPSRL